MQKRRNRLIVVMMVVALVAGVVAVPVLAQDEEGTPFLGVRVGADDAGAQVLLVYPRSAADKAGVIIGDVITAVNGEAVTDATLADVIQAMAVGDTVVLTILRDGESIEIEATLEAQQDASLSFGGMTGFVPGQGGAIQLFTGRGEAYLGVTLNDADGGVMISAVAVGSPAEAAGLQTDDLITALNGDAVSTASEVAAAIRGMNAGDTVTLDVTRGDETLTIEATLDSRQTHVLGSFGLAVDGLALEYDSARGALVVNELSEDNTLYDAGLRAGDAITAINGEALEFPGLMMDLRQMEGDTITLTIERDGETMDLEIPVDALGTLSMPMIETMPFSGGDVQVLPFGDGGQFFGPNGPMGGTMMGGHMLGGVQLGVQYIQLNASIAEQRGVDVSEGALITAVVDGSPAAESGLQEGDVVQSVNGEAVNNETTLADRVRAYEDGDVLTLEVWRAGETLSVEVTVSAGQGFSFGPAGRIEIMPGHGGMGFGFGGRNDNGRNNDNPRQNQGFSTDVRPFGGMMQGFMHDFMQGFMGGTAHEFQFDVPQDSGASIQVEPVPQTASVLY